MSPLLSVRELEVFVIILYMILAVAFAFIARCMDKIRNMHDKVNMLETDMIHNATYTRYELAKTNLRCTITEEDVKKIQSDLEDKDEPVKACDDEPKLYTFLEVIEFLKNGAKIRRHDRSRDPDIYYQIPERLREDEHLTLCMHDIYAYDNRNKHFLCSFTPSISDITDRIWEVVED